mgnify:CR=1 FL=1
MTECEGIGKNVEKAIEDALLKLRAERDDVDIKILETGGLFKKAKVMVSISEDCLAKYMPKSPTVKNEPKKVELEKIVKVETVETSPEEEQENTVEEPQTIDNENIDGTELEICQNFVDGLLKALNLNATTEVEQNEKEVFVSIVGPDANSLIGYRGDCLNNLQYLLTVVVSKHNRHAKHIRLDIDGYREKRKQTLEALARRVVAKVQKSGKQYKLEPMSAYERRIIHTTVQEFDDVTSISKGDEPHRFLIIKKK